MEGWTSAVWRSEARWLKSAINRVCRVNRWNRSELARHLGVSHPMITHYRTGRTEPNKEIMKRIEQLNDEAKALERAGRDADGKLKGINRLPRPKPTNFGKQEPLTKNSPKSKVRIRVGQNQIQKSPNTPIDINN